MNKNLIITLGLVTVTAGIVIIRLKNKHEINLYDEYSKKLVDISNKLDKVSEIINRHPESFTVEDALNASDLRESYEALFTSGLVEDSLMVLDKIIITKEYRELVDNMDSVVDLLLSSFNIKIVGDNNE